MNVTNTAHGISDLYNSTAATSSRTTKKALDSADFMKLLAVQFQQQDPMKPMEDTAFIAQMAQFTSLEQTQGMSSEIARLRAEQQLIMGNSYLGRTVTAEGADGKPVTGVVTAMENTENGVMLHIGDSSYALSTITRIETTPVVPTP
jgi:flagellar basal-body rod modification protein FlgD